MNWNRVKGTGFKEKQEDNEQLWQVAGLPKEAEAQPFPPSMLMKPCLSFSVFQRDWSQSMRFVILSSIWWQRPITNHRGGLSLGPPPRKGAEQSQEEMPGCRMASQRWTTPTGPRELGFVPFLYITHPPTPLKYSFSADICLLRPSSFKIWIIRDDGYTLSLEIPKRAPPTATYSANTEPWPGDAHKSQALAGRWVVHNSRYEALRVWLASTWTSSCVSQKPPVRHHMKMIWAFKKIL